MPFMKRKENTPQSVIGRVLAILSIFNANQPCWTLSEISQLTQLPITTTFRLLTQMIEWEALIRDDHRRY
jgi:DNA-binding IclR family transcriptional regulator